MKKSFIILSLIGMIGMISSFVGIFNSTTNYNLELSLWLFMGFSGLACSVLLVEKRITEKEMKNKL